MENTVGMLIRDRRKELKITQQKLAELSGVSRGTIAAIESGRCNDVLVGTLCAIADSLESPVEIFFDQSVKSISQTEGE